MDNLLKLNGQQFSWNDNKGTACASDLGIPPGRWPAVLGVTSHKTGRSLAFTQPVRVFSEVTCKGMPTSLVKGNMALEFVGVEYTAAGSDVKLLILND